MSIEGARCRTFGRDRPVHPDPDPLSNDTFHYDRTQWAEWQTEAFSRSGWYPITPSARLGPMVGYAAIGHGTTCNGVAVCQTNVGTFLYVANFADGTVDGFDCRGNQVGS